MKVQECSTENNNMLLSHSVRRKQSPSFRAGALDLAGGTMQWIQDRGFLASFLIQDGLGMTGPRVITGFNRDREVTGKYNMQEGFEVLGREGLTGPLMMAMAPIALLVAAKFGKSTSVNSQLIKRFGNSLKDLISKPEFNKDLLKNKDKFQEEFFKDNIKKILTETVGEKHATEEHVNKLLEHVKKYLNIPAESNKLFKRGTYQNACMDEIVKYINDLKYTTSSDLDMLERIKFNGKSYSTKDAFDAMIKYSEDILALDKNLDKLDNAAAENLKNKSIGKRALTNIGTIAATLTVMSILPKLYARNSIAPGARTAMELEAREKAEREEAAKAEAAKENNANEVSFKGKAPNASLLEKFGKWISEHVNDKMASEIEYNGHNFTNTLMAGLSVFGLLLPRGARAVSRAQVDENGKKDLTELYEILIRDLTSSLAVVFAVPMLTRALVSSYESISGHVLIQKDRGRTGIRAMMDLLNPYSSAHVLSNGEIKALYNDIDTKAKMLNFCEYIDKNGGDLQKILSGSEFKDAIFNEKSKTLDSLAKMSKKESNAEIKKIIENLGDNANQLIKDMMQKGKTNNKKMLPNKIFSNARGLNSVPALITTFIISPLILGWFIPRLTYTNTRRIHAKRAQEREQAKINTAA